MEQTQNSLQNMTAMKKTKRLLGCLTCLRHLMFPIRMCWHTSFWTTGWELLSNWVKKLRQKPWNHGAETLSTDNSNWTGCASKAQHIKPNDTGHNDLFFLFQWKKPIEEIISLSSLPRRVSAAHWRRGLLPHTSAPCTGSAGCSGVCALSHPPDVWWPLFVLPSKNCTHTQTLKNKDGDNFEFRYSNPNPEMQHKGIKSLKFGKNICFTLRILILPPRRTLGWLFNDKENGNFTGRDLTLHCLIRFPM